MPTHIGAMSRHGYLWPVVGGGGFCTPKGKVVLKYEQERKQGGKKSHKNTAGIIIVKPIMRFDFGLLRLKYSIQEVHINDKHI